VTYARAFNVDFSIDLRERRSTTLLVMQEDAIDIEGKIISLGKMKKKQDQVENKKVREECGTFDPSREPQEAKIDEMSRLIRNLTNKMSIFEIENIHTKRSTQEGGVRNPNPNHFIRPPNPQLTRRERINEEQPIDSRVKNNNDNNSILKVVDERYDEYIEEIHLLQYDNDAIHLIENDYEESLNPNKLMHNNQPNKGALSLA
jgi:hypothetical protein